MSDLDNMYEAEETINRNKKGFNWKLLSIVTSTMAFISLFGIWYANNERAFLAIENNKLKAEVEYLKEEIKTLQAEIALKENQVRETGSEGNQVQDTNNENSNETSTTETGTAETGTNKTNETQSDYSSYVVKPGDSLIGISISLYGNQNYASQIAELNGLTLESLLQVGQTLKVPGKPGN